MFYTKLSGIHGSVVIPAIGLTVGTMAQWTATRREETSPDGGEWDLRAVFSYLNEFAWKSEGWTKEIILVLGHPKRGLQYRLTPTTGGRTVLEGRSLLIEGASLWPVPKASPTSSERAAR